jgi:hypothetical protein
MAITKIVGFQQYQDYLNTVFSDFGGFGNLPLVSNNWYSDSHFQFVNWQDRVWLYAVGWENGTPYNRESSRHPSFSIPFRSVYPQHMTGAYKYFWIGFRMGMRTTTTDRPHPVIHLHPTVDADTWSGVGLSLLDQGEIPNQAGDTYYFEVKLDFEERKVRRWMDGVELAPIDLPDSYLFEDLSTYRWYFNDKGTTASQWRRFYLNDLYFMVDTSQDADGLPSTRLGPVYVKPLIPETVIVPPEWTVPVDTDPVDLVTETIRDPAMRDVPALQTDSAGTSARVRFTRPDVGEGSVLYTELELYGYRQFGDGVQLHTRNHQGNAVGEEKTFELEPERLKVGENAIRPGSLHVDVNGEEWTKDSLANLELEIWTTKIE